jgi:hypothetical protein
MGVQKNSSLYTGIYIFAEYRYGLKTFFFFAYFFQFQIFWLGVSKLYYIYITRFYCNAIQEHLVVW